MVHPALVLLAGYAALTLLAVGAVHHDALLGEPTDAPAPQGPAAECPGAAPTPPPSGTRQAPPCTAERAAAAA